MQSPVGSIARDYMSIAISDFYSKHPNSRTRLVFSWRDSGNDTVAAASADLVLNQRRGDGGVGDLSRSCSPDMNCLLGGANMISTVQMI
ncbi:hypothetical protein TIFTF001_035372 [Ficus carica]|uniref:Uncharacterized protein n=1 Tax=Ficus carica TaxID=3494 RepID=A0AA88JA03_FICCA|nr:hypothetical protein TIFTF001_035372 [Ficus carica]